MQKIEEDLFFEMVVDFIYESIPRLGIFFTNLEDKHVYWINWIRYKDWVIRFECRDDYGVILSSIKWKRDKYICHT